MHEISLVYFCLFLCVVVSVETCNVSTIQVTAPGKFLNTTNHSGFVLEVIDTVGQKQCVRKCLQNHQCSSVNYRRRQLQCEMMTTENGSLGVSLVIDHECEYIEMTHQPQQLAGLCSLNPCEAQCTVLSNGNTFCSEDNICPSGNLWNITHRLCFTLYTDTLSWQEAVNFCNSYDQTRLAVLDTTGKIEAVKAKSQAPYYWIGASYNYSGTPSYGKNAYYWNTGEEVHPTFLTYLSVSFNSGQCLILRTGTTSYIFSTTCSDTIHMAAVCEFII